MEKWENPFELLGASPSDSRIKLTALMQNAVLLIGEEEAQKAYADLLNPEERLRAEIRWMGGNEDILSTLNGMVAALDAKKLRSMNNMHAADLVESLCSAFGMADAQSVTELINESRKSAGILMAQEMEVREALDGYQREVAQIAAEALGSPEHLGSVISKLAQRSWVKEKESLGQNGLVLALGAEYEIRVAAEMAQEREGLFAQAEKLCHEKAAVKKDMDKLCGHISRWNRLVLPLRRLSAARGLRHIPSAECYWQARKPLDRLFNQLHLADVSLHLANQLRTSFSDMEELQETIDSDCKIIGDFQKLQANQNKANNDALKKNGLSLLATVAVLVLFNLFTGAYVEKDEQPVRLSNVFNELDPGTQKAMEAHSRFITSSYLRQIKELNVQMKEIQKQLDVLARLNHANPTSEIAEQYKTLEESYKEAEEKLDNLKKLLLFYEVD